MWGPGSRQLALDKNELLKDFALFRQILRNQHLLEWLRYCINQESLNYCKAKKLGLLDYAHSIADRADAAAKIIKILSANTSLSLNELWNNYADLLRRLNYLLIQWLNDEITEDGEEYFKLRHLGLSDEASIIFDRMITAKKILEELNY